MNEEQPPGPEHIAESIKAGDRSAELLLIKRYSRGVMTMLVRRTGDRLLAEDLHQETFIIVLRKLRGDGLNDPTRLAGFIHATARNLYIGHLRGEIRRDTISDGENIERHVDQRQEILEKVLRLEKRRFVRQLIDEVKNEGYRELLRRRYVLEQSNDEICSGLGISRSILHRKMSRARDRFRELIGEQLGDSEGEGLET